MMHPTPTWLHTARVYKHRWWRPLLWAGLLTLALLLMWQAATSGALWAAVPGAVAEPWRFVDESKPGAPTAKGELAETAGGAPTQVAARFNLSSTMQALALQLYDPELSGLPLTQVEELSYCTRLVDGPRPYAVMLQLNVDADVTDGDESWQGRLVYTPSYNGAVIQGEWQCWNTLVGKWWATGGPVAAQATIDHPQPLGTLLAHFPNLGVNATYHAVVLKAGDGWNYFRGEASPVVIGIEGQEIRMAFGTESPANGLLLPMVYQKASPPQPDDADDNKDNEDKKDKSEREQEKQEKKEQKAQARVRWGDFDWADVDWENFDWEKVDWENIDWGAWGGERSQRAEAVRAFVEDVQQCKEGGWEEKGFRNPGDCVAYYIEEHTPSDFGWGRNSNDVKDDDRDDRSRRERDNDDDD